MPAKWTPVPKEKPDSRWEVFLDEADAKKEAVGTGGFGEVFRGKDKGETRTERKDCAAKKVNVSAPQDRESFVTERTALEMVGDHKYIVSLYGHECPPDKSGWLFLELATGGELFDRLIDSGSLSERAAWPFISSLASALGHCHAKGVMHRDVKLENVMLVAEDPRAVKLIDFGLALMLELDDDGKVIDKPVRGSVGTQAYRAPEIAAPPKPEGHSPLKVDVWALGIVAFSLVAGFFPLLEAEEKDWRYKRLLKDQKAGVGACTSIFSTYKRTCKFSPSLMSLIDGMLTIDDTKRLSMAEVVAHPWIVEAPADVDSDGGPVYRGVGSADDDMDDEDDFMVPEDAVRLTRQAAQRLDPMDTDAGLA